MIRAPRIEVDSALETCTTQQLITGSGHPFAGASPIHCFFTRVARHCHPGQTLGRGVLFDEGKELYLQLGPAAGVSTPIPYASCQATRIDR